MSARWRGAAHKFQMFDFRFAWTPEFFSRSYSFWAGLIGGCFLTTASHGTEQLMVQRLLAAKTEQTEPRRVVLQLGCDLFSVRAVPLHRRSAVRPLFGRRLAARRNRPTPSIRCSSGTACPPASRDW